MKFDIFMTVKLRIFIYRFGFLMYLVVGQV